MINEIKLKIKTLNKSITLFVSLVWLANGLLCKILNLTPRHEQIVARILDQEYSRELTILIGIAELIMSIWVLSKFQTKLNALIQIVVVLTMNIIEFFLVPDLLLWGKYNILFALIFTGIVYYNEFSKNKALSKETK